jgi:hypothetical protein
LSLDAGPVVIVGDETSVAVAAAFAADRPTVVRAVIQSDAKEVPAVAGSVGLLQLDVASRGDTASTVEAVTAAIAASPTARVALTGGSELIVAVRSALRRAGMANVKTKTYWIPGRRGLD